MTALDELSDHDLLMHIDAKLTLVIESFNKSIDDHECRIRCMESNQNKFLGVVIAVSTAIGIIGSKIGSLLFGGN